MIYIFRHQEGDPEVSNCLSSIGMKHSNDIANRLMGADQFKRRYYACMPRDNGKHVRPIQTAGMICTKLSVPLTLVYSHKEIALLDSHSTNYDNVIVWHHKDIPNLLRCYVKGAQFVWPNTNYSGCLVVDAINARWWFFNDYRSINFRNGNSKGVFRRVVDAFRCF